MFNSNNKESPITDADINTALRILIDYVPKAEIVKPDLSFIQSFLL